MSNTNNNGDNPNFHLGPIKDHHGDIPNNKLPKGPTPEEHERIMADVNKEIQRKFAQKPLTDTEIVVGKVKGIHLTIKRTAAFLVQQGRNERLPNRVIKDRLQKALASTYRDEFMRLSKEELIEALTYLHVGITCEALEL